MDFSRHTLGKRFRSKLTVSLKTRILLPALSKIFHIHPLKPAVQFQKGQFIPCKATVEPPITDPPMSGQPLYNGHWLWHQRMLLDSGQRTSCVLPTDQLCTTAPLITDKQETTPTFMQELVLEGHENFNIELQRSRGVAIAILRRRCLMGQLLLRSSMRLIGLVDQLSVHYDRMGIAGQGVRGDRSTDLASGCFSFSSTSV